GASFGRECPSCGTSCSPGAKFCRKCRTPLGSGGGAETGERDPRSYTPKHLAERILAEQAAMESSLTRRWPRFHSRHAIEVPAAASESNDDRGATQSDPVLAGAPDRRPQATLA